jgi:hypothetical protein
MKNPKRTISLLVLLLIIGIGAYTLIASDHIDAPGVRYTGDTKADITDLYVFADPQDTSKLVFVCNIQGLYAAGTSGTFDANVLIQFKIASTTSLVEDQVIQCTYDNNTLTVRGPAAPNQTGTSTTLLGSSAPVTTVAISSGSTVNVGTNTNGIKIYAGPRDDPFFFDLVQYKHVVAGTASCFNNPGTDTFAGTNVLATVVEVPKSLLPRGVNNTLGVWATSSR